MKLLILFLLFFTLSSCSSQQPSIPDDKLAGRTAEAMNGMIVSESKPASEIGRSILEQGGNAFDAAIAVSFALSVYRPHSTGIGGGGFALTYHTDDKSIRFLDMRERAPKSAKRNMYQANPESSRSSGLSVGIPGTVAGLKELYEHYGSKKLSWNELIEPAAKLAEDGFSVYSHLRVAIEWAEKEKLFEKSPALKRVLLSSDGDLLKEGEILKQPTLARTLRTIGQGGARAFYNKNIAVSLVKAIQKSGGIMTQEDLKNYQIKWRAPLRSQIGSYEIVSSPPPSSGGVAIIQMLKVLEKLQEGNIRFHSPKDLSTKRTAMKIAFADRATFLGDPDFSSIPVNQLISNIHIQDRLNSLSNSYPTSHEESTYDDLLPTSTTHFCIADKNGNIVSSTQSINYFFGSGVVDPKTGIILNNTMDDFAADPGKPNIFGLVQGDANAIAPGKTPLSSMTPTLVMKDGRPFLTLGSPGGPKIITGVMQVLHGVLAQNLPLEDAVHAPRIHHQWQPDITSYEENDSDPHFSHSLSLLPGTFKKNTHGVGNVSALKLLPSGKKLGVSDPRREGWAAGY